MRVGQCVEVCGHCVEWSVAFPLSLQFPDGDEERTGCVYPLHSFDDLLLDEHAVEFHVDAALLEPPCAGSVTNTEHECDAAQHSMEGKGASKEGGGKGLARFEKKRSLFFLLLSLTMSAFRVVLPRAK